MLQCHFIRKPFKKFENENLFVPLVFHTYTDFKFVCGFFLQEKCMFNVLFKSSNMYTTIQNRCNQDKCFVIFHKVCKYHEANKKRKEVT